MYQLDALGRRITTRLRNQVVSGAFACVRVLFPILFCLLFYLRIAIPPTAFAAWPVEDGPQVVLGFDEVYSSSGSQILHCGVDISAGAGDAILAPQPGTVSFVGAVPASDATGGQTMQAVSLTLADGRILTLMPFDRVDVEPGASIKMGDGLGALAATGDRSASGTHLHVGLKRGGTYFDPLELLGWQFSSSLEGQACEGKQTNIGENLNGSSVDTVPSVSAFNVPVSAQTIVLEEPARPSSIESAISSSKRLVSSGGAQLDSDSDSIPVPGESMGMQSSNVIEKLVIDIEALVKEIFGAGSLWNVAVLLLGVSGAVFGCLGMAIIAHRLRTAVRAKGMNTERRGSADKDKLALVADR